MSSEISIPQPLACSASSTSAVLPAARLFQFGDRFRERQVAAFAVLVELREAAVFGRAGGQRELFVVGPQVGFGRRVVVGVDDRDVCAEPLWWGGRRRCAGPGGAGRSRRRWARGCGWRAAARPSGCRWARAALERATSSEAMQLARPRQGAAQTPRVRSFRGTGARRWTPRPRACEARRPRAIRRERTRGSAKAGRPRRPRADGWTGETAFSGARSAGGVLHLSPADPCGRWAGPAARTVGSVGCPAGHNRIVTAWSRLAHRAGGWGNHPLTLATSVARPARHHMDGMIAGDVQCAPNGAATRRRPVRHYAVRACQVLRLPARLESAVARGSRRDRGGAVALCTLIVYPLKHVAPVVSLASCTCRRCWSCRSPGGRGWASRRAC